MGRCCHNNVNVLFQPITVQMVFRGVNFGLKKKNYIFKNNILPKLFKYWLKEGK